MKYIFFFTLFFASMYSSATSYLCIGEAGAGVEHGGAKGIHAEVYNVDSQKFVISNDSGKWAFKELGKNGSALECDSEYYCEVKGGFASIFFREKSGVFTYISNTGLDKEGKHTVLYTIKGRCSAL